MGSSRSRVKRGRHPTRRELLIGLGAVAARCGGRTLVIDAGSPFPLGVASGDPLPSGALLWTRFTGEGPLRVAVWEGESDAGAPVYEAEAPVSEGTARVDVGGLRAGTRYTYGFTDVAGIRRLGRFNTAFAEDSLAPLRFGATCCTNYRFPMDAIDRMGARSDLDLFAVLGDNVYADAARDRAEYREYWHQMLGLPGWRTARAATAMIPVWDDHEFTNNWAKESIAATRFEVAFAEFVAHQPIRLDPSAPTRTWRKLRYGRTAEFFVLDCRGERKPSTREGPTAEYISRAQMDWLKSGLSTSPCVFKIILNSVPISEWPGPFFQSQVADRWEGYAAQRTEILSHIDDNGIGGVLWVAGDFHLAARLRISRSGPGSTQLETLVGPGANVSNPSPSYPGLPQADFASGINNYAQIDLDPASREVRIQHIDGTGRAFGDGRYVL